MNMIRFCRSVLSYFFNRAHKKIVIDKKEYIKPIIEKRTIYAPPYTFRSGYGKVGRPLWLTKIYVDNYDGDFEKDEREGNINKVK